MKTPNISIVSPVYRAEKMVHTLVERIVRSVTTITEDYEIILVNDASPDASWQVIEHECAANTKVKGINLSRNFGQHYAITAGLHYAKGEWVVVMDCDLQDRPEEIPALYQKAMEGYDSVFAQRVQREDTFFKRISSKVFYKILGYLTDTKQDASIANFGIYHSKVIQSILHMGDKFRYFPTMVQWVGYKKGYLPVTHQEREEGKTSYNLSKLCRLALDTIIAFSDKPMRLMVKFGFIVTLIAFVIGLIYFVKYLMGDIAVVGYTSLIISLWIIAGIIISLLGIVGLYIGKMFDTVKDRPTYVVSKEINVD